jgi:para-nitrobenzyl esterase
MDVAASFHNERDAIVGGGSRDANTMCGHLAAAWVNFAKTGNPNTANLPTWSPFDVQDRSTLIFAADTRVVKDPYAAIRLFWEDMPGPHSVLG